MRAAAYIRALGSHALTLHLAALLQKTFLNDLKYQIGKKKSTSSSSP